ncbi:1-phosphatidylinositol 4,5-bisphosphate phosphodiesterase beta-1-like isoform X3 [Periophthalmus magnuspinnatus]|uniref:1-phosphatidylinositol 4,5-bisphosphate phosphodiesterase beta-1-like isoform X3 n=1 Tax=Periophthalmus magnuspinnatus TaxID=409849 RepID=UPI002436B434|nr:1-phosphatidylinositol 4,5-bisphosphate phosphodiesterase beta-1-like isoform X3 [Periophthalmus magnuspinnatus]
MASAQPGVHALKLQPPSVSHTLSTGSNFIRWDEDVSTVTPVTLRVDPHGFYLHWTDQNKDTELLDLTLVKDVRTGRSTKTAKEAKLRELLDAGNLVGRLENRMLTVVTASDLVNVSQLIFIASQEEEAKVWSEELFALCSNLLSLNLNRDRSLLKAYVRLTLLPTAEQRIPVKNIVRLFSSDRKRVESALESCGLPCARGESIRLDDFTLDVYRSFLESLCPRPELGQIFKLQGGADSTLTLDQMTDFINSTQRDPRLNEILYPPLRPPQTRSLLQRHQHQPHLLQQGLVSLQTFCSYLSSDDNGVIPPEKLDQSEDMSFPLSHYFINSSHNTYLTGSNNRPRWRNTAAPSLEKLCSSTHWTNIHSSPASLFPAPKSSWEKYSSRTKSPINPPPLATPRSRRSRQPIRTNRCHLATTLEGSAEREAVAAEEMSTLVTYIQPTKFNSFEASRKADRSYHMSSFVETKALEHLTKSPVEFVEYNKSQLSRIYPKGTRVDSSNFMPQLFWNAGCQLVALNYQTIDLSMQLNLFMFEYNGRSGYRLKPEFMRRPDKHFDPFTENTVDGIVANTLSVKVISGQFLSERRVGVYVEVDMFGLPADTRRKALRTKTSANNNAINPVWDEEPIVFKKVILPSLATLRVAVFEEGGKFIGHRIIPVSAIRPGYRYIGLRNEKNQPLTLPAVFVYMEVKDYVPDTFADVIEALSNPIRYVNLLEQRSKQLAALTLEDPEDDVESQQTETDSCVERNTDTKTSAVENGLSVTPAPTGHTPVTTTPKASAANQTTATADTAKAPSKSEDLVLSVLMDVPGCSIESLQQSKLYLKEQKRQSKELKELLRKHQRKTSQLCLDLKSKYKKMSRRQSRAQETEREERLLQAKEEQQQQLLSLRQEQYCSQKCLRREHIGALTERLSRLAQDNHSVHMKKLTDIQDKEKKELKRLMDRRRTEKINQAKTKEKQLAQEEKIEINKSYVNEVVQNIKRLEEAQAKRVEQLQEQHRDLLQHIQDQKSTLQEAVEAEFREKFRCLPGEIHVFLQRSEVRGHSESRASTPHEVLTEED